MKIPPARLRHRHPASPSQFTIAFGCLLFACFSSSLAIDVEVPPDGLDDVWEEFFGAQSVLPGGDEDGDSKTNMEECLAGTDPFDVFDRLEISNIAVTPTNATVTVPTVAGKMYRLMRSADLGSFTIAGQPFYGNGGDILVDLSTVASTAVGGSLHENIWTGIGGTDIASLSDEPGYPESPSNTHALPQGTIVREVWTGINGLSVNDLTNSPNYPDNPDQTEHLSTFEAPSQFGNNYGQRVHGYLIPAASGNYTFWIASDDGGQLWLNTTGENPAGAQMIASVGGSTLSRQWNKYGTQQSVAIPLVAGQPYYIKALHKEGTGGDNLAVAWQLGGTNDPQVIDGQFLSPGIGTYNGTRALASLEIPENHDNDYGGVIRGFIKPPVSGTYTFAIASRHDGELWLSNDENPGEPSGTIVREIWNGINGLSVNDLTNSPNYPDNPDLTEQISTFEAPSQVGDNYGQRIHGYLIPTESGNYTFWIASDDGGQLWLNTEGEDSAGAQLIASVGGSTLSRQWFKYASQQSVAIPLVAGKRYYIKALHKEGGGGDNLAVAWERNGTLNPEVIDGQFLAPGLGKLKVAFCGGPGEPSSAVQPRQWDLYANQISVQNLQAGQNYYFEVLHAHGSGADHCSVAWDPPAAATEFPEGFSVIDGKYLCPWFESGIGPAELPFADRGFYKISVEDMDQDNDGLSDWAETVMGGEGNFSPFDPHSTSSPLDDTTVVANALNAAGDTVSLSTVASVAFEDPRDGAAVTAEIPVAGVASAPARFRVQRVGTLQPVTVDYSFGGIPFPGESAESGDYTEADGFGAALSGAVTVPFGHVSAEIVIVPVLDSLAEYPEVLTCTIDPNPGYTVGGSDTGQCTINDARDIPEQETLFVGAFSEDDNAVVATVGNGFVSGKLNGTKTRMEIWNQFNNLTSPQEDSHIHKSGAGGTAGPIIHEITNVPGDTDSGILYGELGGYDWDIGVEGGLTAQQEIDSLFSQNAQTPLYLNIHTTENAAGEIWAFFTKVVGSINPPTPPTPADIGYPLAILSGEDLEREIWRFLDQATFGGKQAEVDAIKAAIEAERTGGNPTYSRIEAFEDWIDAQMALEQTWLLDHTLAADFAEWKLRGYYDPSDYQPYVLNAGTSSQRTIVTPSEPGSYPIIDHSDPDPEAWVPTGPYPLGPDEILVGDSGTYNGLGDLDDNNRRRGLFTLMIGARDQLRQKMGYALQQINVVSENDNTIFLYHYGSANYQDQLNYHAFGKYRDVIDWVVWSPQMGNYLSSYRNQKTIYDDNGTPGVVSDDFPIFSPDENLAREVMQLFTIGLFENYLNGAIKLSSENGLPTATYDNDNITELSRILTGHAYSTYNIDPDNSTADTSFEENDTWHDPIENESFTRGAGNRYVSTSLLYRMKMFSENHDPGIDYYSGQLDPYDIAGGRSINNVGMGEPGRSIKDVDDALDWLAGALDGDTAADFTGDESDPASSHASTPSFIANKLIQLLVTSNPSSDYIYHVAKAFKDGYDRDFDGIIDLPGGEGDLGAALKTILLHPEARNPANVLSDRFGKKLTALEAELKLIRTMEAHTYIHIDNRADPGFPTINGGTANYPYSARLTSYGYPASQADNFELDCIFRFPDTDAIGDESLTISPFKEETVFSFQLPDYAPNDIASYGLVAPELQLLTELTSMQNINYFETIARTYPDGHQLDGRIDRIGAYVAPFNSNNIDGVRIPFDRWLDLTSNGGRQLYPTSADAGSTSELTKDLLFVRRLDLMLNAGRLFQRYTYDGGDDNANGPGDPGRNPLELIVDLVRLASSTPSNTNPNSNSNAREKMMDAIWSIMQSAEFNIRK